MVKVSLPPEPLPPVEPPEPDPPPDFTTLFEPPPPVQPQAS